MDKIKTYLSKFSRDSHLFELLKGASTTFIIKIFGLLVGYLLAIFITNKYGSFVFGQYVTALLVIEVLSILSRLGIDTALVRFIARYMHKGSSKFIARLFNKSSVIVTLASVFFTLILLFFSAFIADFMNLDEEYLLIVSFAFIPLVLFHMNTQAIRGLKQMVSFSFLNNLAITLLTFIILISLAAFVSSDKLPIYAYVTSVFIMTISSYFLWFFHFSKLNNNTSYVVNEELTTKDLFKVSIPLLLGQSMMLVMGKVDLFMLANMTSSEEVGIYNIALKLSMLAYLGLMAVNSIAAPKFSEIHSSGNMEALKRIVQQSTKIIFWITLPIVIVFLSVPEFVLSIFGEDFKLAALALIILSISKMFSAISGSVGTFLQMVGKQNVFQNILIFAALVNIILNYLLIPEHGIDGAAFASAFSGILWNTMMILYIKRNFGFYTIYFPGITR